jgi:hypothetical protein
MPSNNRTFSLSRLSYVFDATALATLPAISAPAALSLRVFSMMGLIPFVGSGRTFYWITVLVSFGRLLFGVTVA